MSQPSAGKAFLASRAGIASMVMIIFVIIPTLFLKLGFLADNPFVEFFTEATVTFAVISIVCLIATYVWLRPHWFSIVHISTIFAIAYLYIHYILGG